MSVCVCVSRMALSLLMGLLLNISHTNLSFPWQPCVTGATANVCVCACVFQEERETGREMGKEGKREKE